MSSILITGASGFLGSVIAQDLLKIQHTLTKVGITATDDIYCNIATSVPDFNSEIDWVIHVAGKAHVVPKNAKESEEFFQVNFEGTKNLIKGIEQSGKIPKSFVFISTVAVYGLETGENIAEDYDLNGSTSYALSKIQAEEYLIEWCSLHNVKLGILRPSLLAGKNPPGNLGAMINGIKTSKYLRIGDSSARKSILMAEDIARIIPKLAEVGGIYNVCDNHHPSFRELEELISKQLNKKAPRSIPYWVAKSIALVGDVLGNKFPINSNKLEKITKSLTFSNERAKRKLNWEPMDVLKNFQIK
jgi:nucleoside-diphosphate-sugar epimerase